MTTIFRKTEKGTSEIATRANKLVPRLRTALILVDGVRSQAELGPLIGRDAANTLEELLSLGYIEVASVVETAPPKPPKSHATPATPAVPVSSETSFASFRAEAVRAFNDLVGPPGESLAMKMEKVTSRDQLAPLLQMAHQIITNARGAQAANEFKARFASF